MTIKAFQSSFNPVTNYLWPDLAEKHPNSSYNSLWVSNLAPKTPEQEIRSLFAPIGPIVFTDIVKSKAQTFAFISYRHWSSGVTALCSLNGHSLNGRKIHVAMYVHDAQNRRASSGSRAIFLEGVPDSFSETELFTHLRGFGLILSLSFLKFNVRTGPKRARVEFIEERDAHAAVQSLNMSLLWGQRISACPWNDRPIPSEPSSRSSTGRPFTQRPLPAMNTSPFRAGFTLPRSLLPVSPMPLALTSTTATPEGSAWMKINIASLVLRDFNRFSQMGGLMASGRASVMPGR